MGKRKDQIDQEDVGVVEVEGWKPKQEGDS